MTRAEFRARIRFSPLLLDGAMGTELERGGVDTSGTSWSARAIRSHSNLIQRIHEEYILAGADIITANTFRTNLRAQRAADKAESEARELTLTAIAIAKLAREATGSDVLIAGSIAPVEDCFSPELAPSDDEILSEHRQMVRWLDGAGVDLILIETMSTLREARLALQAVRAESALPVVVSLVPKDASTLLDGSDFAEALPEISRFDPEMVSLNCGTVAVTNLALDRFASCCGDLAIPFGIYANLGHQQPDGGWDVHFVRDSSYSEFGARVLDLGASMIGSCCGSAPTTTAALRMLLNDWNSYLGMGAG